MNSFWIAALDLFLGAQCAACGAPGPSVCPACRDALGKESPHEVTRSLVDFPVVASNDYRPILEHVIPTYKDDGALHLNRMLGQRLAVAVQHLHPLAGMLLVPVPSTGVAVRRRGYDHARRLAAAAARAIGLPWASLIQRRGRDASQRTLNAAGRRRNVEQQMRARPRAATIILVDDVITTGASLMEAARAARAVGMPVHGAAVLGDADRPKLHNVLQ